MCPTTWGEITYFYIIDNSILKTDLWERLLRLFIAVELINLFISPSLIKLRTSAVNFTVCIVASGRVKPLSLGQLRISNLCSVKERYFHKLIQTKGHVKCLLTSMKMVQWLLNLLQEGLELAHCIFQPFEHEFHNLWCPFFRWISGRDHWELGNWFPYLLSHQMDHSVNIG